MGTRPIHSNPKTSWEDPINDLSTPAIGRGVKIVGQVYSKEELYIDGDLEGTVEALGHKITIGPNASVHARVKAREVVVLGTIHGNVEGTDKIEIRKDAKLVGDIRTTRIIIEDGAYFKGSIDIVRNLGSRLAFLGTPQAAKADALAEQEIKEGKYDTVEDVQSFNDVLFATSAQSTDKSTSEKHTAIKWVHH